MTLIFIRDRRWRFESQRDTERGKTWGDGGTDWNNAPTKDKEHLGQPELNEAGKDPPLEPPQGVWHC